jgi:hypothetical protein
MVPSDILSDSSKVSFSIARKHSVPAAPLQTAILSNQLAEGDGTYKRASPSIRWIDGGHVSGLILADAG